MPTSAQTWVSVTVALAGPALVAIAGKALSSSPPTITQHAVGLLAIAVIVIGVFAFAVFHQGYSPTRFGLGRVSLPTFLLAATLTAFFVLVFGPFAFWFMRQTGARSFDAGLSTLGALPAWYLILTVVIVASAEEFLYRGVAIEQLADLTGSHALAGGLAVLAFGLAHVPLWGWAPALTTVVSGSVMTAVYLWRHDLIALIIAHVATDLYGIVLAPYLASHGTP